MPQNTQNLVIGNLIGCTLGLLAKLKSVKEGKIHETLEIKLKVKTEFNESSKVLNRDQRNIVNTNSWKLVA